MKYQFSKGGLVVRRNGDRKFYSESVFFYHLKQALREDDYDVIKKEMVKDGNMVSEGVYYIRSRNTKKAGAFAVWDSAYAIRATYEPYNQNGEVALAMEIL